MKKSIVLVLFAAAVLSLPVNDAKAALVYTVTGTVVDDPQLGGLANQTFIFTYTAPASSPVCLNT